MKIGNGHSELNRMEILNAIKIANCRAERAQPVHKEVPAWLLELQDNWITGPSFLGFALVMLERR